MFGLKLFARAKTKKFAKDKDRRQFYAIQNYYKKKASNPTPSGQKAKPKSKR